MLSFDSEGKPAALKFPAGCDRAVPGGMQPPALFLASDLHHPDSPAAQPRWQEPRQSSAGPLWCCWSCWRRNGLWVTRWFGQVGSSALESFQEFCWEGAVLGAGCPWLKGHFRGVGHAGVSVAPQGRFASAVHPSIKRWGLNWLKSDRTEFGRWWLCPCPPRCLPRLSPHRRRSVSPPPCDLMAWTHLMGWKWQEELDTGAQHSWHPSASSPQGGLQQGQGCCCSEANTGVTAQPETCHPLGEPLSLRIMRGDPFAPTNVMSPPLNSQPFK